LKGLSGRPAKRSGIEVIDMAVNVDHVHLFIKYPPKYSVSFIAKKIKGRTSRIVEKYISTQDKIKTKPLCAKNANKPSTY